LSGRLCFASRSNAGDRITRVRLVSPRGEEIWNAPGAAASDSLGVLGEAGQAAAWVAAHAGRNGVALLVVDVGGGECRWVTAPGAEPQVVAAAIAQAEDWGETRFASPNWAAPTLGEATVQALAPSSVAGGRTGAVVEGVRVGALAISDVSARLFLDALDERGVDVERAVSLWHALSLAWDAPRAGSLRHDVVASSPSVSAVAMVDPDGRLVWAWSRAGELLAGGVMRLPVRTGVQIARPEVGRLAADWLSWSLQLGCAPTRVVVLSPPLEMGADALSPAQLGTELGKVWPGATVDLAVHDDPISATLLRLAGVVEDQPQPVDPEDGRQALLMLSQRPGRAHRAMYRWVALALLVGSVALGAVAIKAWRGAAAARAEAREARGSLREMVAAEALPPNADVMQQELAQETPRQFVEQRVADLRRQMNPNGGLQPAKPILAELDALSFVLGNPDFQLMDISLDDAAVLVTVQVPDTPTGEALVASIRSVSGSRVAAWQERWQDPGEGRRSLLLMGQWASGAAPAAGAQP
jgi:hypothetical protein